MRGPRHQAILLLAAVALVPSGSAAQEILPACVGGSPSVAGSVWSRLTTAAEAADEAEVRRLTECLRGLEGPVVEPGTTPGHLTVTFLLEDEGFEEVQLVSNVTAVQVAGIEEDPGSLGVMARPEGSALWGVSMDVPADVRVPYRFRVTLPGDSTEWRLDPRNPRVYEDRWPVRFQSSELALPAAPPQPWREWVEATGRWEEHPVGGREVSVYLPPLLAPGAPVVLALQRVSFVQILPTARLVDHLVERGLIEAPLVLSVDLADGGEAGAYRTDVTFLADTLLPWARARWDLAAEPSGVVATGTSRRGLVAAIAGFDRPDAVGKVLALSGSFHWSPPGEEREWLARRVAVEPTQPVEFFLAAGSLETVVTAGNRGHYMLSTNRHLRDVLRARGNRVVYREFGGGHDELGWQTPLALGLSELLAARHRARRPALLLPGTISTDEADDLTATFAPDGSRIVFVRRGPEGPFTLHEVRRRGDGWSEATPLPFSGEHADQAPAFSADGGRLFFQSRRPTDPSRPPGPDAPRDDNLWSVDVTATGWGRPAPLPAPIHRTPPPDGGQPFEGREMAPALDAEGNAYFWSHVPGDAVGATDVYVSRRGPDGYAPPENLGPPVSSPHFETHPWIAPDGSYLLFSCDLCPDALGRSDLYVSRRIGSTWSPPMNLGSVVNSEASDFGAEITPDRRWLTFSSNRSRGLDRDRQDVYWIPVDAVPALDFLGVAGGR